MKRYEKFWDWIAKRYARSPVRDEAAYRAKLEKTREYFTARTKVFEFGCGTGSTAIYHAPYVERILAIDVSPNMIAIARAKAEAKQLANVRFEVGSIEDIEAPAASYDVVMAHSILHLLKDPDAALAKAHAMLVPGGVFVSSTTCMGDAAVMRAIGYAVAAASATGFLPHIAVFSSGELIERMKSAGFAVEYEWRPHANAALFVVARKEAQSRSSSPRPAGSAP